MWLLNILILYINIIVCLFFFFLYFYRQRNLYQRFKSKYFTDDVSISDEKSSSSLSIGNSDTIQIGGEKVCSVNCLYESKLDESVLRILPLELQSTRKQQQQQVIAAEMGDTMENNHDGGGSDDAVRKVSTSEETEKDDKFPQQMANNSKNANWNTMELGEKRKRLR